MKHILLFCFILVLISCKKQPIEVIDVTQTEELDFQGSNSVEAEDKTYYSTDIGPQQWAGLESISSTSTTCGIKTKGYIDFGVHNVVDNNITYTIKNNSLTFSGAMILRLRANDYCGEIIEEFPVYNIVPGSTFFLTHSFTTTTVPQRNIYAELTDGVNTYVSKPIILFVTTSLLDVPYYHGQLLGYVNGVAVKGNKKSQDINNTGNPNGFNSGMMWQCVELCIRYYYLKFNIDIKYYGTGKNNAYNFFTTANKRGLTAYANGGAESPKVGDIICWSGGAGGFGHVAIVSVITSKYILIAQQNGNKTQHVNFRLNRDANNFNKILNDLKGGLTIQGWIRK
jgi:surface antigen